MTKNTCAVAFLAAALLAPAALAGGNDASGRGPFIHVEVRESGGDEESVKINLPLSVALVALEAMQDEVDAQTRFGIGHADLEVSDLRRMWKGMRAAGDTEFVTVREGSETVRIDRRGDTVFVQVDDRDAKDAVRIQLPVAVLDALLAGEGETLDLQGAVEALGKAGAGEILRIEDAGDFVRVWID